MFYTIYYLVTQGSSFIYHSITEMLFLLSYVNDLVVSGYSHQ